MKTTKKFIAALLAVTLVFVLFSCNDAPHVHTFSEDWSSDETYHWHKATCGHTEEVSGKAEHTFEEVTVDSTCTEEGKKSKVCSVCGYEKNVTVIPKSHHLDENLKCSNCGKFIVKDLSEFNKVATYLSKTSVEKPVIVLAKGEYKISAPYTINIANLTIEGEDGAIIVIADDYKPSEDKNTYGAVNLTGSKNTIKNITFKISEALSSSSLYLLTGRGQGLAVENSKFLIEAENEGGIKYYVCNGIAIGCSEFSIKNCTFTNFNMAIALGDIGAQTKAEITGNKFTGNTYDIEIVDYPSQDSPYFTEEKCKELSKGNNNCKVWFDDYNDNFYFEVIGDNVTYLAYAEDSLKGLLEKGGNIRIESTIKIDGANTVEKPVILDMNQNTLSLGTSGSITIKDSLTVLNSGSKQSALTITGAVAKVGDASSFDGTYYTTLEAAIDAVGAEGTVSLLGNCSLSTIVNVNKSFTLKMEGKTVTSGEEEKGEKEEEVGGICINGDAVITVTGSAGKQELFILGAWDKGTTKSNRDGKYTHADAAVAPAEDEPTFYSTLHDAVLAGKGGETVYLLCDASGSGLETKDESSGSALTIDFNTHTYTMTSTAVGDYPTQAMHWGTSTGALILKNGTFKVAENIPSEETSTSKKFNMAMQCYRPLTITNMTLDFTNVPIEKYDESYREKYPEYVGKEKAQFNCYKDATFENCTIKLSSESRKGMTVGANIKLVNTTLDGYANFEEAKGHKLIVDSASEITKEVVSYFDSTASKTYKVNKQIVENTTTYTLTVETTSGN